MKPQSLLEDLQALEGESEGFGSLERLLGAFNPFEVLRIAKAEIRHSNVLAWLIDSEESHGLGGEFGRRWFERILHKGPGSLDGGITWDCPGISFRSRREWSGQDPQPRRVDVLVEVMQGQRVIAVVCIENKIGHFQTENQLKDYRGMVENAYRQVPSKHYLFLTSAVEAPDDPSFHRISYDTIFAALEGILAPANSERAVSPEVSSFLAHYQKLLRRYLMNDSPEMQLAMEIYRKHRKAIDYIIEIRPDDRSELTRLVLEKLSAEAESLKLVLLRVEPSRGLIRFIPRGWDTGCNRSRGDWCDTFCQIEMCKGTSAPRLIGTTFPRSDSGKILPHAAALHRAANGRQFPHSSADTIRNDWYAFYRLSADSISIADLPPDNIESLADDIFTWVKAAMKSRAFAKMNQTVTKILTAGARAAVETGQGVHKS